MEGATPLVRCAVLSNFRIVGTAGRSHDGSCFAAVFLRLFSAIDVIRERLHIKSYVQGEKSIMIIKLEPINDNNRDAVLALSVREDQPFVATNDYSLREAAEANAKAPGTARPFAICAGEKIVGFCMLALDPEDENPVDRYCLWRFMIDKNEQGKGYGQAALHEIIKYFKENGVDTVYLSTAPANARGLHVYHKAGFKETGEIEDGEAIFVLKL